MNEKLIQEIITAANEYIEKKEIAYLPVTGYGDYLKTGDRLIFEKAYFYRRRQLAVMGLAYQLKPNAAYLAFLEQVIWEVCNEYTWALPAHLPIANQQFTADGPFWLDLFSAETAQALGEIYETSGEDLSPLIKQRLISEIDQRIFKPLLARPWDWEFKENNWSSVVGGAIGMAALSILPTDSIQLTNILERLETAMASYLAGFGDDGVCMEGVGYWGYGFGYYLYYAEKLAEKQQDNHLLNLPKAKQIAGFPYFAQIQGNQFVPFADYTTAYLPTGLLNFCRSFYQVEIPELRPSRLDDDHCYRYAHLSRSLKWQETKTAQTNQSFAQLFPDAQWFLQKNFEQQTYFAAKGGTNDESHNQLDVGNFVFATFDELFLTDLGAGEYTRQYFDDAFRYQIKPNDATSHSVPIINQKTEQAGHFGAKLQTAKNFALELCEVYQLPELKSFIRSFEIAENEVNLSDKFLFSKENNQIQENFISQIFPEIQGKLVTLAGKTASCQLIFETDQLEIIEETFKNHNGIAEKFYRIVAHYPNVGTEQEIKQTIRLIRH